MSLSVEDQLRKVEGQLDKVLLDIESVNAALKDKTLLRDVEAKRLEEAGLESSPKLTTLMDDVKFLRKQEEALRKKDEDLRKEKEDLRKEKQSSRKQEEEPSETKGTSVRVCWFSFPLLVLTRSLLERRRLSSEFPKNFDNSGSLFLFFFFLFLSEVSFQTSLPRLFVSRWMAMPSPTI